ncbi:MAG: hypothetical protein K0S18_293 [Anaerocolumna sp.]|jgi:retron-type reverse transcriptase|nr:hypothetical protein [Anaerocolumna sp.]
MDVFSQKNLLKVYQELKLGKLNTGLDRLSRKNFDKSIDDSINIIKRKITDSTYEFTPYKEILLLKGKDKLPRVISIPTIRDKIVLKILGIELKKIWGISSNLQETIESISEQIKSNKYKYFLKMDVSGYYSSIPHDLLINALSLKIRDANVLELIIKAVKTQTYSTTSTKNDRETSDITKGIPQGISISNGLGYAYLKEFDTLHKRKRKYKYFRYVDDILVLCENETEGAKIQNIIEKELQTKYILSLGDGKEEKGLIDNGISFLGYKFNSDGRIEISKKNISRLEVNIETLFHEFINSSDKRIRGNTELIKWKIDLKICGIIKNKKTYGWVYYFRRNENTALMHRLDDFILKMIARFHLEKSLLTSDGKYKGKKFVNMFYEIKNKGKLSDKITNVDNYSTLQKREILKKVCKRNADTFTDVYVDIEFNKFIFKSIHEIEYDLQQQYM